MKKPVAPISTRIVGGEVSGITQKLCARCSAKVKKDVFCPPCRKFFRELSKPDPALATTVHRGKKQSPRLSDMSRDPCRKAWISRPPGSADPDLTGFREIVELQSPQRTVPSLPQTTLRSALPAYDLNCLAPRHVVHVGNALRSSRQFSSSIPLIPL
jgi:hypothetical protein